MKASRNPLRVGCTTPGVTGKSEEYVPPVRYAAPKGSIATENASSASLPPRYVEKRSLEPLLLNVLRVASSTPPKVAWTGSAVGKSEDSVMPATYTCPFLPTASDVMRS